MWKFCEVEICPWHEKRSKRKEFYANRKSKKKIFRKDNESDNDREKSDDTTVKTKMRGNVDHTEKKTLPTEVISQVEEPDKERPKTENKKRTSIAPKRRPKTAPPTTQNQQVPWPVLVPLCRTQHQIFFSRSQWMPWKLWPVLTL